MPGTVSSARPDELFSFSDWAQALDRELGGEGQRASGAVEHFFATCREYAVHVTPPGLLCTLAGEAQLVDGWVRRVGEAFRLADWAWWQTPALLIAVGVGLAGGASRAASVDLRPLLDSVTDWLRQRLGLGSVTTQGPTAPPVQSDRGAQQTSGDLLPEVEVAPDSNAEDRQRVKSLLSDTPHYGYGSIYTGGPYRGDPHPGVDTEAHLDDPVRPIGPGKIVKIKTDSEGYGRYMVVEHELADGRKVYSLYGHMTDDSPRDLKEGDKVDYDTILGKVGMTGSTDHPHTHVEVRTEEGYTNWKTYEDLKEPGWKQYWLNPAHVVDSITATTGDWTRPR